jgi:hypothetical protein
MMAAHCARSAAVIPSRTMETTSPSIVQLAFTRSMTTGGPPGNLPGWMTQRADWQHLEPLPVDCLQPHPSGHVLELSKRRASLLDIHVEFRHGIKPAEGQDTGCA